MTRGRTRLLPLQTRLTNALVRIATPILLGLAVIAPAHAELMDQVEVNADNGDGEIVIRFGTTVQYQRHQPSSAGNLVTIEFQVTGAAERSEGRLLSESRRHPGSKLVPAFEVNYDGRSGLLTVKFARYAKYSVGQGKDPRSIRLVIPGPQTAAKPPPKADAKQTAKAPKPAKPDPAPVAPMVGGVSALPAPTETTFANSAELENQASSALAEARTAMKELRAVTAIDLLNRVLNLPPTASSQEAQELIGQAREFNGENTKARAEYELYLKLYPASAGAERVRARLATLGTLPANRAASKTPGVTKPEYSFYGSVSSYYYHGSTKYDATLAPPQPGLNFDQVSLTGTDQSALVTNIDLNARYRGGDWDSKLVVRDTSSRSFIEGQKGYNRLNNAYVETLNRNLDFFARAGRQSSPGFGILGRFDGAWLRYGFNPRAKVSLFAGEPVEFYPTAKKKFAGGAVDLGPFAERWSGNVFAIEQRVDGFGDRRAVGSELRYLDPQKNGFALLDYDPTNKTLNIALIQGNWQVREGLGFNLLFDRRRSPTLQLTNSLSALPLGTVRENIDSGISLDELRNVSRVVTPISTLFSVGATYQYSPAWQISGDIKYSEVSGTGAIGSQMAMDGTGKVYVYGLQAIRTGALTINDIIVATTNIIRGKTYNGELLQLSHVILLADKWRIESTLKYYRQVDSMDNTLSRLSPSARISYRLLERLNIEGEAGAERSTTRGPLISDKTMRRYYNLGMRYDFF